MHDLITRMDKIPYSQIHSRNPDRFPELRPIFLVVVHSFQARLVVDLNAA